MFVHTVIMVIEPHMKQGRQHKLISTIFLATSVTKKLDHNSLRHTSVTYKLKLSGGDIKAVQGDSGHAQADMVTEVYGHIIDEDRRKNAQRMEDAFYNRENLNPQMKGADAGQTANTVAVPEGVDADLLMKVLGNPEMAALLTSLAKSLKAE